MMLIQWLTVGLRTSDRKTNALAIAMWTETPEEEDLRDLDS